MPDFAGVNANIRERYRKNRKAAAQAYSEIAQLEGITVPDRIRKLASDPDSPPRQEPVEDNDPGQRDLSAADLLGRPIQQIDLAAVSAHLKGSRVLVTGAGGSIGGELCGQIAMFDPQALYMLDRSETGLRTVQRSMEMHPNPRNLILADVKDRELIVEIFRKRRPEVVIHAAGLEYRPLLEDFPNEAWRTNVEGTRNVLSAAIDVGVRRFVNVSSVEADRPHGIYGHLALLGERLTVWAASQSGADYFSVRIGNVIEASGVLDDLVNQIERGGPVLVSGPETTRYFISKVGAAQLILEALAIGARGQVLTVDMGEPLRVLDLTRHAMELLGKEVKIAFTGLRPDDRLHDSYLGEGHTPDKKNSKIWRTEVPLVDPEHLSFEALQDSLRREAEELERFSAFMNQARSP